MNALQVVLHINYGLIIHGQFGSIFGCAEQSVAILQCKGLSDLCNINGIVSDQWIWGQNKGQHAKLFQGFCNSIPNNPIEMSNCSWSQNTTDPDYQKLYDYMMKHPELLTKSNDEGLDRVKKGGYAYLMESSSIEYYTERACNLTQVGEQLDDKAYGIGMRKS